MSVEDPAGLIDPESLPSHIAIIMDGNGRWARKRGLPRVAGHRAGIQAVREVVETSAELGVGALTLYAFSQENWKRPQREIRTLMELLKEFLAKEIDRIDRNGIRFDTLGDLAPLSPEIRQQIQDAVERTRGNTGMRFNVALNYSGRAELVRAVNEILSEARSDPRLLDGIDEAYLAEHLYTRELPDPDLLIRTSGEFRLSNFLLWQVAYSEIWVTSTMWPDFRKKDLYEAIASFQKRERRYGGLVPELASRWRRAHTLDSR